MAEVLAVLAPGFADGLSRRCVTGHVRGLAVSARRGWTVVEELLATATFEPGMFRLVAERGRVEPDLYLRSELGGGVLRRALRPEVLEYELARGATLTVNGADRLHAGLLADREVLEYAVGRLAWCNGYLTYAAASAFGRHSDDHDVVVVQAEGRKRWTVFAPGTDEPVLDRDLRPGDVLHVPAGWEHVVTGLGEPTLHWTFGFVVPSRADLLLAELGHRASADPDALLDPGTWPTDPAALDVAARSRVTERRTGANLPWSLGAALPPLHALWVRWAARLPPVVAAGDGRLDVCTLGRRLRLDARLRDAMDLLARGDRVLAAELVGGEATEPVVRAFLTWSLRHRLVLLEEAP
ncbi:MAG: JmjC domain-containing protein [Pseudonocardia sp.]